MAVFDGIMFLFISPDRFLSTTPDSQLVTLILQTHDEEVGVFNLLMLNETY